MLEKMKKVRRMSMLNLLMSSNTTTTLNQLDIKLMKTVFLLKLEPMTATLNPTLITLKLKNIGKAFL